MRALKTKYKKAKCALKERFAEAVAPGQASSLAYILSSSEEDEGTAGLSNDTAALVKVFNSSDKFGKLVALSLASKTLTKSCIMETFDCSKRQVDNARSLQINFDGIHAPKNSKHHRFKLDMNKCEHFLDFIFNNGLLQDVAYGTATLEYDNGEKQKVPHAIVVARFKHVISYYLQFCSNDFFEPLSESSLNKILKQMNPSQRKSLAGLDDTTADGLNGFKTLENTVSNFVGRKKHYLDRLEQAKRYLKIVYPQNCQDHSPCPTHCISLALSDPSASNLQRSRHCSNGHSGICNSCNDLHNLLNELTVLSEELTDDVIYDVGIAKGNILKWQHHIIRHVQQNKAKVDVLDLVNESTCLWIRDYCQKVLPMQFRESQCSYFGKKGMSLHVDVFLMQSKQNDGMKFISLLFFLIDFSANFLHSRDRL